MKILEAVRIVQFFQFEKLDLLLSEITGIFGGNGSGKSSLIDAIQICMMGANSRLVALNAQADEKATTRSLRSYCLGQHGETSDDRARDNATTYITLLWRDTETNEPLSMGVCICASADGEGHDVMGRYLLPGVELLMSDHLEIVNGEERPRAWPIFRHQMIEKSKISGEDPLYNDAERYISAALLALRGDGSAPVPEAFKRAFKFGLRMRFDKDVDQIVRDDVLESRPTNIKKFKEVTESFRRLAKMVAEVQAKIADGEKVSGEFAKAAEELKKIATWGALSKMAAVEVASEASERAIKDRDDAEQALTASEAERQTLETQGTEAKAAALRIREQREAHSAHKDYGALQTQIQAATAREHAKGAELVTSLNMVRRTLNDAANSDFLKPQAANLLTAVHGLEKLGKQIGDMTKEGTLTALRPALKAAKGAFNALYQEGIVINGQLEAARNAVATAQSGMERANQGRGALSSNTTNLHRELSDGGVNSTPVCDLVRITDPDWQPVIEAYLGRNVEALLVSAAQEKEAFRIYRGANIYGAKIAMESRQSNRTPESGSVAELIEGDHPAAVAYLRRQFGDLMRAQSDNEALSGQRTLTKDGMLVRDGDIDRLRPVRPVDFRIGAGSSEHRDATQRELARWQQEVKRLEALERALTSIRDGLMRIGHEDGVVKFVTDTWGEVESARREIADKTQQLKGAADGDYVRLGEEEATWTQRATDLNNKLKELLVAIGRAQDYLERCNSREAKAQEDLRTALAASEEARQQPDVDRDFESRQWDVLLEKFGSQYDGMVGYVDDQQRLARRRMEDATSKGNRELGTFLEKFREQAPQEIATDWRKAKTWLEDLLQKLNDTELAPYKEDMDAAYRTSQETFRNDVAIALNNNLEWLEETMGRLNAVLRECPPFSNGERYRFVRKVRPQLESLMRFVKNVAAYGPGEDMFGGAGDLPDEFRTLLEDKVAAGAGNVSSPLDDYREFFEFDIEILREDPLTKAPKVVGHLSKRLGSGSGGEHRAPLYVIAGAALASAYRLDRGNKNGPRLMLIDEAFNKMDLTNIIASMRYLEELGLQVFMASPGENLGILTAFLHRYYDILNDKDNKTVMIEGHDVKLETRLLFREDLPEFNPTLVADELAVIRGSAAIGLA